MAQQTTIVVFDGLASPVSHSFSPEFNDMDGGIYTAKYRELLASLPILAQPRLTLTEQVLKSGVTVRKLRCELPVLESATTAGVEGYTAPPKVALTPAFEFTYFAHPRDVLANQRNLRQMAANLLGGVATSVTPVTTGTIPEFFDAGLKPY